LSFERRCTVRRALIAVVVGLVLAGGVLADIPQMVGYQGMVTDNSGNPVADGTYTMRFRIYTAVTGGTLLWDSNNQSVTLAGGVFSVMLGESPQPALGLAFDQDYWLLVTFSGQNQSPRKRLGSVGYAYMASGVVPGTLIEGSVTGGTACAIKGRNTAFTGLNYGVRGENTSSSGVGTYGWGSATTGTNYGVYGITSSTSGRGVYGAASTTAGTNYGGRFYTASSSGRGVHGRAGNASGTSYGVYGESAGSLGRGVYGVATSTVSYNFGVLGETASQNGHGVHGRNTCTDGNAYGVYGWTDGGSGAGVSGYSNSGIHGYGVKGEANGVIGGAGVRGEAVWMGGEFRDTNSNNYCYAGYSTYKTYGTGTNAFVQNHPRDSDRVIVYAAPEGDEVATYTRGTARLIDGEARVPLGETFGWVTNPDIGLTAHLTPRGQCSVLCVESLTTTEMVVRSMDGFPSDIVFDYLVYGLRIGFEGVTIVQQKQEEAYIPSMEDHRMACAEHPDLRQYNALERFKRMSAAAGLEEAGHMTASTALRDAIEEYDPAVHGPVESGPHPEMRRLMEEERRRLEEERTRNDSEDARVAEAMEGYLPDSPLGE
jgi:hypothetical protein